MDYEDEEARVCVMVFSLCFFNSVFQVSSLSNIWCLWLSSRLSSFFWSSVLVKFFLRNKIGVFGSWIYGLRWFWLCKVTENHVDVSSGCVQEQWKDTDLLVFEFKLGVAEGLTRNCSFLWLARDDISGSLTSLCHDMWYVFCTVVRIESGEGRELVSSTSLLGQVCLWSMDVGVDFLMTCTARQVTVKVCGQARLGLFSNKNIYEFYGACQIRRLLKGAHIWMGFRFIMAMIIRLLKLLGLQYGHLMISLLAGLYILAHQVRFLHICLSSLERLFQIFFNEST